MARDDACVACGCAGMAPWITVRRADPRATELLGAELAAVLDGPARRLAPAEIDRYLTRIEEL